MSTGRPDPNAPATVANAWAAGMAHVDVYIFRSYPINLFLPNSP